jgi:hypothetical protein
MHLTGDLAITPQIQKIVEKRNTKDKGGRDPLRMRDRKSEMLAHSMANPADFAEIRLGYKLSPQQRKALEMCKEPGYYAIACCNEGGKTSRILPALVLWHQLLWPAGKTKVTSGAFQQIEDQVWPAIYRHKDLFPAWHWRETPSFESLDEDTGLWGFCKCFTTNHPGRAEGDHEELPNSPLLFIVDEAKTCATWLKQVLVGRVRPTRLVLMSSHGFAEGWFYEVMRLSNAIRI